MTENDRKNRFGDFLSILRRPTGLLNEELVREELFSVEKMEQCASYLASEFKISPDSKKGRSLLPELNESGKELLTAYLSLAEAVRNKQTVAPAAEWFLDNFHIVEEQLRSIKRDLPIDFYEELPKLSSGDLKGYPRVYAIALTMISHTDSRLDIEMLRRFLQAYQQVTPLRIGELWAVAITLKIALIEQLKFLALRIVSDRIQCDEADRTADRLLDRIFQPLLPNSQSDLIEMLANELGPMDHLDRAFIVQLVQRLRDQDPDVWPAFDWIERSLKGFQTNTLQVIQLEHQRQASAQVTVGNIITSLRFLSDLDWRDFLEGVSVVDTIMAKDPVDIYSKMDFATRDRYRHAIERIAKHSKYEEPEIARKAVEMAEVFKSNAEASISTNISANISKGDKNSLSESSLFSRSHIGYYLIGDGVKTFEQTVQYRFSLNEIPTRFILKYPTFFFLGALVSLSCIFMIEPIVYFLRSGGPFWGAILFGFIAFFLASELALSVLNHYITFFMEPRLLPKMDMTKFEEVPAFVVIPTLFSNESTVKSLLKKLEIHYLSNSEPYLYFALLGDFLDSNTEALPEDSSILQIAVKGIEELNQRYSTISEVPIFYLFHRKRQWNSSEEKWMGWERKRGKILEFNRLLRGASDTSYMSLKTSEAKSDFFSKIKYVITLDSDTCLPRNCARRLIGTILHPLNRPQYCPKKMRVVSGYGILQPRVSVSLESAMKTRFSKIFSGNTGLDPYTTAVSDVYQDLFLEGSFTGKGLYDVDAFEIAVENRGPENAVLSHDLFEGSYARTGLVTDIELFDDYPSHYDAFSKREHRWTRGDWQIARWILPWVPNAQGELTKNNMSLISRWKIFDNLRRSLVIPMAFILLVLAWTCLPGSALLWTFLMVFLFGFPIYVTVFTGTFLESQGLPWAEHLRNGFSETRIKLEQILLMIIFLADQAWNHVDAISRTLYRKLISHRKLLEWVTFAQTESRKYDSEIFSEMLQAGPILSILVVFAIFYTRPDSILVAAPFLIAWISNSLITRWLMAERKDALKTGKRSLTPDEIACFRVYARKTWHFFETFVVDADHRLAPDNFQEDPKPVIAHRTSPTNIGLQLLSTASAFDLGYLGTLQFVESLEATFETLSKLQKHHGHFYNWYDTLTLEPLHPRYISTVDSGNFAGHILALKQCLRELCSRPQVNHPIHAKARVAGLIDTLKILLIHVKKLKQESIGLSAHSVVHFEDSLEKILASLQDPSVSNLSVEPLEILPSEVLSAKRLANLWERLGEADDLLTALTHEESPEKFALTRVWMKAAIDQLNEFRRDSVLLDSKNIIVRMESLMLKCEELIYKMEFGFLFDEKKKLFTIGYNVSEGRCDLSYYDLLASEARTASFVAIAKGEIAQEHWFRLGRQMTNVDSGRALIAWTATMFEYLMPLLVMKRYGATLIDETYKTVVARQISYGREQGVPWGVSEAGYNARDLNLNYQYGPFGIPGLGLKRGLSEELVVSPYSTMLACVIDPRSAFVNLQKLEKMGALAQYGFYESIDYTPSRLPKNQKFFILRSFMAHHQGMSLVSLNNLIHKDIMQTRFHSDPLVQATELLLQERVPKAVAIFKPRAEEVFKTSEQSQAELSHPRYYSDVTLSIPRTQLLSNGNYSVMVTSSGSGYSHCKWANSTISVNRWREDWTRDSWGSYFYIRNRETGKCWSSSFQPTLVKPDHYEVTFSEDKVEFQRQDGEISTHTEIIVAPEDNVELRRISLTNHSDVEREFDITSYLEVVLAKPEDDLAHPAFSNLFIQTEFVESERTLLASRRLRSKDDSPIWAFHVVATEGESIGPLQYETDRSRFIGRGHSVANPLVFIRNGHPLSNTTGSVLDPIFSLREPVRIAAHSTVKVVFTTGLATSRENALRLADKYRDYPLFARESEIAWIQSQVQLRHLNMNIEKAHVFQRLAGRILYSDPSLRPRSHVLALNTQNQTNLWVYGISGDLPIILVRVNSEKDIPMVSELLHAHEFFRWKGLAVDLVLLNERPTSYLQTLQDELNRQIRMTGSRSLVDQPGGVFIKRADLMSEADLILLKSVARVTLSSEKGTLDEQLKRRSWFSELPPRFKPNTLTRPVKDYVSRAFQAPTLSFFNGLGGFTDGGKEYVTVLREGQWTPSPWINVIANEKDFGFIISESGSGYTWSMNSRENRLTPWSNDSISDPISEAIYVRDEDSGVFWSPTPMPIRNADPYICRHGQGYSEFEHTTQGIQHYLKVFVPVSDSVKITQLKLKNLGTETRRLSVSSFTEWVLGVQRGNSAHFIITEKDERTGALFAKNPYNNEFSKRVAFAEISEETRTFTCDRREFLGRNGNTAQPAALSRQGLSGRRGAGFDPCAAFHAPFDLAPGEEREIILLLGQADDVESARALVQEYREKKRVEESFTQVMNYWSRVLTTIEIKTPDEAMNIMVNRWLLYQTLSCRIWARSAFYQSGGAYGFRDQLQDSMALVYSNPTLAREHILRSAARQFKEGDVQHWWHPPTGRGVRTHFSDDLLWLPFVTCFYVRVTADTSIWNEKIPFIEAALLKPGQDDSYITPTVSTESASLLEHCCRAVDRSMKVGSHGLPLMGSGDWNDGMNRVGHEGKGESVWVAWFLMTVLEKMIPHCEMHQELLKASDEFSERAALYQAHWEKLKVALEEKAWDGEWYLRAFFDDGTPLGSSKNEECRLDSISQSWAVLSGAGDPERSKRALAAVDEGLVRRSDGLIQLFTPPFNKSAMDPGYVKGYLPGVRENGGQYTHAAIWTMMAFAELGDGERVNELYSLLNPIHHSMTRSGLHKYRVEPYVMAADIYGQDPHVGRGGWTWYTGSSSWMYRACLESILGFELNGNTLKIKPCISKHWSDFEMIYRPPMSRGTEYRIKVVNQDEETIPKTTHFDGIALHSNEIPLLSDGKKHFIQVWC